VKTKVSPCYHEGVTREFTAVIQKKGRWYVAWVEEIPGVNTQGKTLAEARRNLKDALRLILEVNRRSRFV